MASSGVVTPTGLPSAGPPKKRRRHSIVGIVLLLISLGLFAVAGFHIWRMVQHGYSYACTGEDCNFQTDVSNDLSWVTGTIPFAIIALVASIMAFTFHRVRTAWGAGGVASTAALGALGGIGGIGGFGSLPLIARTIGAAIAGMRGQGVNWTGMQGGTIPGMPGMTWPGMTGTPGAPGGWPGLPGAVPPGTAVGAGVPSAVAGPTPAASGPGAGAGAIAGGDATPGADPSRAETIAAMGLDAEAVISGMHDVGMVSGTKRMYELDLAVTLPGTTPYRVKHLTWVPVESIGKLYSGGRLRAKVDPIDHNSLVLDLDAKVPQ